MKSLRRVSRDDVERLSRGQPSKQKGYGSRSVPHRLNDVERAELNRAQRKGYVSLTGRGNRRTRKGSPLANTYRQWCDARGKPQIILYKSTGSETKQPVDRVLVDLSPLRLHASNDHVQDVELLVQNYMRRVNEAAANAEMDVCWERIATNGNNFLDGTMEDADEDYDEEENHDYRHDSLLTGDSIVIQESWATKPIWQLPFLVLGEYEGPRSQAKAMAKELSTAWQVAESDKGLFDETGLGIPSTTAPSTGPKNRRSAGAKKGGKSKMKGLSQHRKRGGGHRQSWY